MDEGALSLGEEIGKGGQGRVLRVTGRSVPLVFKQYIVGGADPAAMRTLVELPAALRPAERSSLLGQTAWPLARVVQAGTLRGFLMQQIPAEFTGLNAVGVLKLRELQYLLYEPKPLWGGIVPPGTLGTATRVAVAAEFTRLMSLLHDKALVVGDVSMSNVLWAPGDPARIFVIDCDGVRRLGGRPVLPQAHTPDWDDPHQPRGGPDLDTDRYKLALLIGRVLVGRPYIRPERDALDLPSDIPPAVAARVSPLWRQAGGPRGTRPAAGHWLIALQGRVDIPLRPLAPVRPPPAIPRAELDGHAARAQISMQPPEPSS